MIPRWSLCLLVLTLSVAGQGRAQPGPGGSASKVDWRVQGDTLESGEQGVVTLRAVVAEGWKMYAPDSPPPTRGVDVAVESASPGLAVDSLEHTESESGHDPNFGITVRYFQGTAELRLPVSAESTVQSGRHSVDGDITFMVCTDEICLPPTTESFSAAVQVRQKRDS